MRYKRESPKGSPVLFLLEDRGDRVDNKSMPQVTPQYGPGMLFQVGALYNGGYQNGLLVYSQPGGVGTPVFPQPPQTSPPQNWRNTFYKPTYPFVYVGLLSWGCKHWTNTCECIKVYDEYTEENAALLCCPVCSYIGYIIEPYDDWEREWFSIYPTGIVEPGAGLIPNLTE